MCYFLSPFNRTARAAFDTRYRFFSVSIKRLVSPTGLPAFETKHFSLQPAAVWFGPQRCLSSAYFSLKLSITARIPAGQGRTSFSFLLRCPSPRSLSNLLSLQPDRLPLNLEKNFKKEDLFSGIFKGSSKWCGFA